MIENKIVLGLDEEENEVLLDIQILLRTRLLLQASSGGGKSYTAKRIMEQTHGEVQHIIFDTEGEFPSLREKFDYLLVGPDGDIRASLSSAETLAEKVMKIKVSTIIDLSDFTKSEKCEYIQKFLNALMELPREYWTPVLIFIDEAHDFAPEGKGASKEAIGSKYAIASLCSKGRKRSFCPVLMSQRISKLSKDAAAECQNKLTGLAVLDIDRGRAAEELGFNKEQERKLRDLEPGEFWGFGPALTREVTKIKISKIKTSHEQGNGEISKITTTPENIKKLLKDLNNLDEEAQIEAKTKDEMQEKIRILESKLKARPIERVPVKEIDQEAIDRAVRATEARIQRQFNEQLQITTKNSKILQDRLQKISKLCEVQEVTITDKSKLLLVTISHQQKPDRVKPEKDRRNVVEIQRETPIRRDNVGGILIDKNILKLTREKNDMQYAKEEAENRGLGICPKKIYSFLAHKSNRQFTRCQIGAVTGYSVTSGGFKNAISQLRTLGLIEGSDLLQVKIINEELMINFDFSVQAIVNSLPKCEKEIFEVLKEYPNTSFGLEELAGNTPSNYRPTSGGYKNALSRLKTLGLIEKNGGIKLHPDMLEFL
jgi:hypothetical protein